MAGRLGSSITETLKSGGCHDSTRFTDTPASGVSGGRAGSVSFSAVLAQLSRCTRRRDGGLFVFVVLLARRE